MAEWVQLSYGYYESERPTLSKYWETELRMKESNFKLKKCASDGGEFTTKDELLTAQAMEAIFFETTFLCNVLIDCVA